MSRGRSIFREFTTIFICVKTFLFCTYMYYNLFKEIRWKKNASNDQFSGCMITSQYNWENISYWFIYTCRRMHLWRIFQNYPFVLDLYSFNKEKYSLVDHFVGTLPKVLSILTVHLINKTSKNKADLCFMIKLLLQWQA